MVLWPLLIMRLAMELPYNFFHRLKFAFTVEHWLSLKATQAGKNPYTQLKKIKKIAQYIWRLGSGIHILSEISLVAFTALPSNPRCFMLYEDDIPPAYWTNVSLSENYRIGNEKQVPSKVHSCCLCNLLQLMAKHISVVMSLWCSYHLFFFYLLYYLFPRFL